jgi:hypothetical protein
MPKLLTILIGVLNLSPHLNRPITPALKPNGLALQLGLAWLILRKINAKTRPLIKETT